MSHKEVYKWFELYFPQYSKYIKEWFPNGKNSVRVRQINGQDFVFTFNAPNNWRFETVGSFINELKGVRKMKC